MTAFASEPQPKLIKIIFEYEDEIRTLEGDKAQEWLDACNEMTMYCAVHGNEFPHFEWGVEYKK